MDNVNFYSYFGDKLENINKIHVRKKHYLLPINMLAIFEHIFKEKYGSEH